MGSAVGERVPGRSEDRKRKVSKTMQSKLGMSEPGKLAVAPATPRKKPSIKFKTPKSGNRQSVDLQLKTGRRPLSKALFLSK